MFFCCVGKIGGVVVVGYFGLGGLCGVYWFIGGVYYFVGWGFGVFECFLCVWCLWWSESLVRCDVVRGGMVGWWIVCVWGGEVDFVGVIFVSVVCWMVVVMLLELK